MWIPGYIRTDYYTKQFKSHNSLGRERLGPKLEGVCPREASQKVGPIISATVAASNFKFGTQLGFGSIHQKTTFRTKIGGGPG